MAAASSGCVIADEEAGVLDEAYMCALSWTGSINEINPEDIRVQESIALLKVWLQTHLFRQNA